VSAAFTQRRISAEQITDELLDKMAGRRHDAWSRQAVTDALVTRSIGGAGTHLSCS
jgi:hypothetical protein